MEAATVQNKKAINKGKLKKTIKNVLCCPDPIFWPLINEEHKHLLETTLNKHMVDMPEFEKPHWNELKLIPKAKRPKPPKLKRVEGLMFGLSECSEALKSHQCAAVMIEASINPRIIVQPVLEACIGTKTPVICVNDLRTITKKNFKIPTSCLGIKSGYLSDIRDVVAEIAKCHKIPQKQVVENVLEPIENTSIKPPSNNVDSEPTLFTYLYRADNKSRVFNPSRQKGKLSCNIQQFKGQDFIEFKEKSNGQIDSNSYMKMIVKRISNNPNRVKSKKKNSLKRKDTLL